MKPVDVRLDRMMEIAQDQDVTLDEVVRAIGRADQRIFDAVSERPSRLPRYMKSKVNP